MAGIAGGSFQEEGYGVLHVVKQRGESGFGGPTGGPMRASFASTSLDITHIRPFVDVMMCDEECKCRARYGLAAIFDATPSPVSLSMLRPPRIDARDRTSRFEFADGGMVAMEELGQELIGTVGMITVPVKPGRAGEVILPVRGGTEAFAAHADEVIAKNARVVVVESLSARSVTVTPCA
jgi:hypothetical protein